MRTGSAQVDSIRHAATLHFGHASRCNAVACLRRTIFGSGRLRITAATDLKIRRCRVPCRFVLRRRDIQSMNVQVSAPSKCRTWTDSRIFGSKLRRFTPWRAPGSGFRGSQCVTHPQVAQRTVLSVLSPWMYS